MLIEFELNTAGAEALLRHCTDHQSILEDSRDSSCLVEALEVLAFAIKDAMTANRVSHATKVTIDPQLLEASKGLFGDEAKALEWLSRPLRALRYKAPIDAPTEETLMLIRRLENGFGA